MGWLSKLLNPISIITGEDSKINKYLDPVNTYVAKKAENFSSTDWLDPIGTVLGNDNKYINALYGLANPFARGGKEIVEGYKRAGWHGAAGALSDAAAYGAGDFISPYYTEKDTGANPIYDRVGPIMAGWFGGPLAGMAADEFVKGTKYDEVANLNLGSLAGLAGGGYGGQNWFGSSSGAEMAGSAGEGGASQLANFTNGSNKMGWMDILGNIAGPLINAGSSLYSSNALSKASSEGSDKAIEAEWNMYQQNRQDYAPWRITGAAALQGLSELVANGPGEFRSEEQPGYQFGFKNFIEQPYLSSQSAKGKRLSGETAKGLIGYAQDYASTQYDNFLNRYYQKLAPYQSLAGVGMTAVGNTAQLGQQTAQNVGLYQYQNALNQGSYQAQLAAGLGSAANKGLQNYFDYKAMQ